MVSVLFVCVSNICRSPAAEAVLRHLAEQKGLALEVASCGIMDWRVGEAPDERMRIAALERGVILEGQAQHLRPSMFKEYDYVLASDRGVMRELLYMAETREEKAKVKLINDFSKTYKERDIPDPYAGGSAGFDLVWEMIEESCEGILKEVESREKK